MVKTKTTGELTMRGTTLGIILCVVSLKIVHGGCCEAGTNGPECVLAFEWQGCYEDAIVDLPKIYGFDELFRLGVPENALNETNNPTEWKSSLTRLACRCAETANQKGLKSFALQFYGNCYGRIEVYNGSQDTEDHCIKQKPEKPCTHRQSICIGSRTGISIYKIVDSDASDLKSYFKCGKPEKNVTVKKEIKLISSQPTTERIHTSSAPEDDGRIRKYYPLSSSSKEESKKALMRMFTELGKTVDVDEIIDLIKNVIKILKRPEIYRDLTVYKGLQEPFMNVLSKIVGDNYKEMWKKSQKIHSLVTLVEDVATTLLLSMELAKETQGDYHYTTPNIDIAANSSRNKVAILGFSETTQTYISAFTEEAFGTAAVLYKGIKDFFPVNTTEEFRSTETSKASKEVASPVISIVAMHDGKAIHHVNGTIRFKIDKDDKIIRNDSSDVQCVYWNENINLTSRGAWSTRGLSLTNTYHSNHSNALYYTCRTNHLTSFAILMATSDTEISPEDQFVLEIVTYVGCAISLICLFLTIVTLPFIRLRDIRFKIHLQLCISLTAAQITFLSGIAAVKHEIACMVAAMLLHYFYTVAFMWMLVEGLHLYQKIVIAYEVKKIKKEVYYAIAWGIPFLIVGVAVAVHREGYGTSKGCWLSLAKGFRWSFIGPVVFIMLVNVIILIKVLTVMVNLKADPLKEKKYHKMRVLFKGVVILLPLLGLTWFFGLMSINSETIVFQYLFSFFNSLQGAFIFLFNYLLNKEVRANFRRTLQRTTTTSV